MAKQRIKVTDGGEESYIDVEAVIRDDGELESLHTVYKGKEINVTDKCHYEEAYAELQYRLPENAELKCCIACRHGNMCPVGNWFDEVFCTKDLKITCKSDLYYYTEDEGERRKRCRHYADLCDDFEPQIEEYYTYSVYVNHLNELKRMSFEIKEDPFYNDGHFDRLKRRAADIEAGVNIHEHELLGEE